MADLPPEQIQQIEQTVSIAMQDQTIPKLYANGFHIGQSASDIFIVSLVAGRPASVQYISFNAAKSLVESLQEALAHIEAKTGQKILSMYEVQKLMGDGGA